MERTNVVLFDFCETLVDFQTADAFVDYVRNSVKTRNIKMKESVYRFLCKSRILDIAEVLTKWKKSLHKKVKLWQLKGLSQECLESLSFSYYNEVIKPHEIKAVMQRLKEYQNQDIEIWLVSGGYDIYLKHFAKENNLHVMVTSQIEFKKGICTGRMKDLDCLRENKVVLMKRKFKTLDNFNFIASYSDSVTDLPILQLAKEANVISKAHQEWADNNNFNEILW